MKISDSKWVGGLAEWTDGDTAYLSIAFTWKINEAYERAIWYKSLGYKVRAGGPALFLYKVAHALESVAEINGAIPDAVVNHNPAATVASRGCPVGCYFCIVPAIGRAHLHADTRLPCSSCALRQQPVGVAVGLPEAHHPTLPG